jgi:hypothetical protein
MTKTNRVSFKRSSKAAIAAMEKAAFHMEALWEQVEGKAASASGRCSCCHNDSRYDELSNLSWRLEGITEMLRDYMQSIASIEWEKV